MFLFAPGRLYSTQKLKQAFKEDGVRCAKLFSFFKLRQIDTMHGREIQAVRQVPFFSI